MARITVEDCLEKVENQYDLVLLAKERTVQLNAGAPMLVEEDNDKRTIISLREIGDGQIDINEVEASAIKRLRKEPDESQEQEEIEEETNDDFENLYKGQVSKSGVAILPSKRTRRIPEVKKPSLADEALSELKAEQPKIKEENLDKEEAPLELSEEVPVEENKSEQIMKKTVSVAPMMDCTDKHEIYFLSLISKNVHLYTEMIVANAIIRGDRTKLLSFKKINNPVTLQIGGSNPNELAEACKISEDYGYKEINLNLGLSLIHI